MSSLMKRNLEASRLAAVSSDVFCVIVGRCELRYACEMLVMVVRRNLPAIAC